MTGAVGTTPSVDDGIDEAIDVANVDGQLDEIIRCSSCDHQLTKPAAAIVRADSHQHTLRNPAGYSCTIACFRDAPGCSAAGDLTTNASWFPGYAWSYAKCGSCGRHLGWWFVGSGPSFVGLIVTRIKR